MPASRTVRAPASPGAEPVVKHDAPAFVDRLPASAAIWAAVALTVMGASLRLAIVGQSLFGDELSTYWIVSTNDL